MEVAFFILLFIFIFLGVPVAFSIALSSFAYLVLTDFPTLGIVVQRMISGVDSFTLLALPFFMLAGQFMSYGTTPRLMRLSNAFLGHIKGGLAIAGVAASAFFGAVSGSGVATCAAVGNLYEPEMVRKGYNKGFIASILAASGALGIVIPPSLPMVVYGVAANQSIGDLLIAGLIPGIMTAVFLAVLGYWISKKENYPSEERKSWQERKNALIDGILPLLAPVIILGGVMTGIATPTESACVAVVYSFILAVFVYKELKLKEVPAVIIEAMKSSAIIALIMAAATPFAWIMAAQQIPQYLANLILSITSNPIILSLLVITLLVILGTFMETIAIIVIVTPILMPIINAIGLDPIHFGPVLMVALAIGGNTPPLAVNLFTTMRIINIQVEDTFPYVLYTIAVMIIALIVLLFVPGISLFLPSVLG